MPEYQADHGPDLASRLLRENAALAQRITSLEGRRPFAADRVEHTSVPAPYEGQLVVELDDTVWYYSNSAWRQLCVRAGSFVYTKSIFDNGTGFLYDQIWKVPLASGTASAVTTPTADGDQDRQPNISPDGSQIVFIRALAYGSKYLYICNSDGSGQTQLDATAAATYPQWHPDGSKILYRIGTSVYTILPDGTGKTTIRTKTDMFGAVWSTDGAKIAYTVDATNPTQDGLWVMNADGTGDTSLDAALGTNGRGGYGTSWPDTTTIVYVGSFDGTGTGKLYKIQSDGTGKTALSTTYSFAPTRYAVIGSDAFAVQATGTWPVYVAPLSGSGASAVSPSLVTDHAVARGQAWCHGGRVYTARDTTYDLVSILPDGSDLRVEDTVRNGPTYFDTIIPGDNPGG